MNRNRHLVKKVPYIPKSFNFVENNRHNTTIQKVGLLKRLWRKIKLWLGL